MRNTTIIRGDSGFFRKNPNNRFVVVDVETTGLSAFRGHRIIEIGAVAVENHEVVGEFQSLVDAGYRISRHAFAIHGITDEALEGAPKPEEIFPAFNEFTKNAMMVAHNARFDMEFLRHEYRRLGFELRSKSRCTLILSRRLYPHLPNHKLETVYRHLFGDTDELERRHRALDDARLTAEIWLRMLEHGRLES
jgi:DNA polymerase-3 subunit epsilon